jgi:HK97 gp10 family phage protein
MADSWTIEIKGLKELDAALSALPDEMQAAPVRAGLKAVGKYLAEGMASRAPRDSDVEGVTLAEEIVFEPKVSMAKDTAAVIVGPSKRAFYGRFLEFGTEKMRAQPFMRPTLDEDGQGAVAVFATHMKAGLERAAKRLAKMVSR